jgi:hypothetical protein
MALNSLNDTSLTLVVLEALARILKAGKSRAEITGGPNQYCSLLEESGAIAKIEELQEDSNDDVYRKAVGILSDFFDVEEDQDMEAAAPLGDAAAGPLPAGGAFDFSG